MVFLGIGTKVLWQSGGLKALVTRFRRRRLPVGLAKDKLSSLTPPKRFRRVVSALVLVGLLLPLPGLAKTVNIGVQVVSETAPIDAKWQATVDYLNAEFGDHDFKLVPLVDPNNITHTIGHENLDFAITNPVSLLQLGPSVGAQGIAGFHNFQAGQHVMKYGSVLFTRADTTDIITFKDLRDKTLLASSATSFGGWKIMLGEFLKHDINPESYLKSLSFSNSSQQAVVLAVRDGKADVGVVRTEVLEDMANDGLIDLQNFRVVGQRTDLNLPFLTSSDMYPEWVFSKFSGTDPALVHQVSLALLNMRVNAAGLPADKEVGWMVAGDLQPVRILLAKIQAGPKKSRLEKTLQNIEHNFLVIIVGLMFLVVSIAFELRRNAQLLRLREVVLQKTDLELDFQKLALDEHSIVSITDIEGTITNVNQKFIDISGYSKDELVGGNHRILSSGQHSNAFYKDLWVTVSSGQIWTGQMKNQKKNGDHYWVKATIVPFLNKQGAPEKYVAILTDITEEKASETQIQQFKSTLDYIEDAVHMFWPDTLEIFYVNRAAIEMGGHSAAEITGNTPALLDPVFDESRFRKRLEPLQNGRKKFIRFRTVHVVKSGDIVPVEIQLQYIKPKGEDPRFVAISRDISVQIAAEQEIRQFRSTLDLTADQIFLFWPETLQFFYLNKAARIGTGWPKRIYSKKSPADVDPDFDSPLFIKRVEKLLGGRNKTVTFETTDQTNRTKEVNLQLITPMGEKPRFVMIVRDISDEKKAARELWRFKSSLDLTQDEVYMFRPDTLKIFYVNQSVADQLGYSRQELFKMTTVQLKPEINEKQFRKLIAPLLDGSISSTNFQTIHQHKNGSKVPVDINLQLIRPVDENPHFVAVVRNISRLKEADTQIQQFQATLDNIVDPVYMFWPDTLKFFYVNRAAMDLTGKTEAEFAHMTQSDLNPDFDLAGFRMRCQPLIFGLKSSITYESNHLNAAGEMVPFEILLQVIHPDGEEPRFVAITRDIRDRKEVERIKSEFVSTVSHELRTPLTSIKGALGLIRSGAVGDISEKTKRLLDIAMNNSERLVKLINDILDVERSDSGMMTLHLTPLDLNGLIKQAIEANRSYGAEFGIRFKSVGTDVPAMVLGDMDRLMQVMANLMSNAAKFSHKGDVVKISLEILHDTISLSVKDKGTGIPLASQAGIFEKFTQADASDKRTKGGSGLGLSIARSIVQAHGGILDFSSIEGKGSTFVLNLKKHVPEEVENTKTVGRILVVEDEPDVAHMMKLTLKKAGYRVRCAGSARDARQILKKEKFDCMTLDIGLPDKNGLQLLQDLRDDETTENIPAVIVSADSRKNNQQMISAGIGVYDWIKKPIDENILVQRLQQVIANAANKMPSILHVENDHLVRSRVRNIIGDRAQITAAPSAAKARRLLMKKRFDLIILDMALPDGQNENLLQLVNKAPQKATPVVIFSDEDVGDSVAKTVRAALIKSETSNDDLLQTIAAAMRPKKPETTQVARSG